MGARTEKFSIGVFVAQVLAQYGFSRISPDSLVSQLPLADRQVLEIVKIKLKDLNATSEEAAFRVVAGTARSMGIEVVG